MFPITTKTGTTPSDRPFVEQGDSATGSRIDYSRGNCPVADDLFDRNISVNLDQWYAPADCIQIAEGINKVLSAYCTEDERATPWL